MMTFLLIWLLFLLAVTIVGFAWSVVTHRKLWKELKILGDESKRLNEEIKNYDSFNTDSELTLKKDIDRRHTK